MMTFPIYGLLFPIYIYGKIKKMSQTTNQTNYIYIKLPLSQDSKFAETSWYSGDSFSSRPFTLPWPGLASC
jgi:hypothetical protein